MRRQQHQVRAFLFGLPNRLRRLDTEFLCGLVFCQNDTVAGLGVAADGCGHIPQVRMAEKLHGGVKAVQITVQDDTVHGKPPFRLMVP